MKFNEMNIISEITKVLENIKYEKPTQIQEQAIPEILKGKDILGCAQTGTGKTAAFAIPSLQLMSKSRSLHIRTLVLTPTRELALQIHENFETYSRNLALKSVVIFGGVPQGRQVRELQKGPDVLIATPGRLLDLIQQKIIDISNIEIFILDEADRMLDMGFSRDVDKVVKFIPSKRQTLLFSATMPSDIKKLANQLLNDPVYIEVAPVSSTAETIDQYLYYVDKSNKKRLLVDLVKNDGIYSALVFARTKRNADRLCKYLVQQGISSKAIHGDKSQNARTRALDDFKSGKIQLLVATDIAARGIDISSLEHVFNFELPETAESYVHRIGRTGRAGAKGKAIAFCDFTEKNMVKEIESLTKKKLTVIEEHDYPMVELNIHKKTRNNNNNSNNRNNRNNKSRVKK